MGIIATDLRHCLEKLRRTLNDLGCSASIVITKDSIVFDDIVGAEDIAEWLSNELSDLAEY